MTVNMVWAFGQVTDTEAKKNVYNELKNGNARFGWSSKDEHSINNTWSEYHSKHLFLRDIQVGDYIVYINTPSYGKCVAVQVVENYTFDTGINTPWGKDFRHCFKIDTSTFIEFNRNDANVLPSVNLTPRARYQRVYAVNDFLKSLENLKNKKVSLTNQETKEEFHLKEKLNVNTLQSITNAIQESHKGKDLESFFAKVFREIPGVVEVKENGSGWKTDFGADLIITTQSSIGHLQYKQKIVVQLKSYQGNHNDLSAVDQIATAIEKFNATAAIIISTGNVTVELENAIQDKIQTLNCPIDLIAGIEVAKFVLRNAPALLGF